MVVVLTLEDELEAQDVGHVVFNLSKTFLNHLFPIVSTQVNPQAYYQQSRWRLVIID